MATSGWGQLFLCNIGKTLKNLLAKNYWADLRMFGQKWSLFDPLPRLLKFYDPLKNMATREQSDLDLHCLSKRLLDD